MAGLNPIKISQMIYSKITRIRGGVEELRYYRFRGGKWYGGIATGDVVGCNLRCKFCWSWRYSFYTDKGLFYSPMYVYNKLCEIARSRGYRYVRLSGGEPTIAWNHLIKLLELMEDSGFIFILETNGILLGYNENYAKELAGFNNVVIRVSFKGTTPEEFEYLTGADSSFYEYQFKSLINLMNSGLKPGRDFYPAVMLSFSPEKNIELFIEKLEEIDPVFRNSLDVEYVILYPHVIELLKKNSLKPLKAFKPENIPDFLV
ncbi:MAG: radical SAM protein [Desulfurococcaceae archaeon]